MNNITITDAYVEITSRCNLRCIHCYNSSGNTSTEISLEDFNNLLLQLKAKGCNDISLSGGEPFCHSNLLSFIRSCLDLNYEKVSIITNGSRVSAEFLDELCEIDPNKNVSFQISVDGINEYEHDFLRGSGSFTLAQRAIKLIAAAGYKYYIHCMIHKKNKRSLADIANYHIKNGAEQIKFGFFKNQGRYKENFKELHISENEGAEVLAQLNEMNRTISNKIVVENVFYGTCVLFVFDEDAHSRLIKCSPRIDSNLNVFYCQMFNGAKNSLGSLKKDRLEKIISNKNVSRFSKKVKTEFDLSKKCESCFINGICKRGCPAMEYCNKDYSNSSDECMLRKSNMIEILKSVRRA